jgi:outer membrane lipoprotein-sorting protein
MESMKTCLATALALAFAWTLHAQTGDPVAFAAKIQQRYNGIKDIQGDFVQTYEGGVLRTRTTERGTVAIKRPGRMRFVYTKPEKKGIRVRRQPHVCAHGRGQAGHCQPRARP